MAIITPDISTSIQKAVVTAETGFASSMAANQYWMFASNTASWIKQANPSGTITCLAKASMADIDFITINDGTTSVLYEFDTLGNGVTGGRVQVNISTDTTAAQVAARLKTAINANQAYITVVDNADGTLTLSATTKNITITESVTDAGFTVVYGPQASAASGSMFVPANEPVLLYGGLGSNLSVLRDAVDGKATLTKVRVF